MTTGEPEDTETCGGQMKAGRGDGGGGGGGNTKLPLSFTTLSTIAIQAGQSLIVVSVLRSGSLVHLQLVQVHPGLCEIGSNQEENQTLIQEHQQLMEKLKKHEKEVLSVVDKRQEEEEQVYKAMGASLNEGWSLLLRLLERRQEVLTLAADFYHRALEFAVSMDGVEDLQIRPDDDRLAAAQLTYDSMRRDLLGKSLQVLTSSSVLMQKLRRLQRTEALQRRGGVLQDQEDEEDESSQSSRSSRGVALRLEELVETLQDRRRRADQAVRLQLQQAENGIMVHKEESREAGPDHWSLTVEKILDQDLQSGSTPAESPDLKTRETSDVEPGPRLDLKPGSRSEETKNPQPRSGSRSEENTNLKTGSRSDLKPGCRPEETRDLQSGSRSEQTKNLWPESRSQATINPQPRSRSEESPNLRSGSRSEENTNLKTGSRSDLKPGCRSEETRNLQPESRLEQTKDAQPRSRSEETRDLQSGSRSEAEDLNLSDLRRKQEESKRHRAAATPAARQAARLEGMLGKETQSGEDHAHQDLLTNQRQQLLSSCELLVDKIWSWLQQGGSVLANSCEAGRQLSEAEDTLNTHLQLHTQAESAGHDAENMKQILDQIRALHTDSTSTTSPHPPSEPSRQMSPLKALTEQLKRGSQTRTSSAQPGPPAADPNGLPSPELAGRVNLIFKELQSLNRKIDSNLQLLRPYVTFLRTAQQVEEELEELREIYRRRQEEEEEEEWEAGSGNIRTTTSSRSHTKKMQQETLQRFLDVQDLGNNYVHAVRTVSGAGLNLQSVVSMVQQTMERLSRTKEEVNELLSHQQIQTQQQQESCRKYRERLLKALQDLNCVSKLLDSCTLMDLGSDLHTSRLLEHFSQARPHFTQLDAEVEYLERNRETLRQVQDRLEVKESKGREVTEDDLSELLELQERVKNKIHQSESILDLASSFHLSTKQLEALLQSDPSTDSTGLCGSGEAGQNRHREPQIQSLFKSASTLKTDICTAIDHSGWTCFRVEQLETRLLSLDSLRVSWLNEAARREEKLRRETLTRLLNGDVNQLRDSFKELKKRFSNLKFNYVKRNDRSRNMKAARNQLQQVEMYDEKLQALRKRLQGVTARLGSEVKDGGVAREVEDAINELQRQMGEFERGVGEHQKTLEMTCRLQQAMEEYQFWCEEASATIARVGKFSTECRSTEAVSVLYRQFEKFVWPTVPQQEERISQITELAVRLHGVEEGRRYIEKTVSKHSEMVESIRQLSDGLMQLEAKLKLESLKQQQSDGEKEIKDETERRREEEEEEKDEEKEKQKENRKMKEEEESDNRSSQEAADMYELKETGHTPELTAEHDGKEVPMKRQTAASRKPPLRKNRSQEAESSHKQQFYNERLTSSYCSTHTFSFSCSPVEANRRIHAIHSHSQPFAMEPQTTPPPSVIGPSFSDIQREFQRKEKPDSASSGSNMAPLQDASAGALSEAELQQQEMMTEDSLSNDEYECVSPDDISLPPLAETPESFMVQSDVEEGFCFSSHSVHVNQYSHQYRAQSEHGGAGAVRQQRESSRSCPTPPTGPHSNTRFRSESSSFVQSPVMVSAPSLVTSILKTVESSTANILGSSEPSFPSGSNLGHKSNTQDSCSNKDDVPEKRSPSQTNHNSQYRYPQRSTDTQGKIIQNVASKGETLPETDPIPQAAELNHSPTLPQSSYCPQPFDGPDHDPCKDKTPPQDTWILKCSTTFPQDNSFPQSFPESEHDLNQDLNFFQTRKETFPLTKLQRDSVANISTSTISQQTIYFKSSPSVNSSTLPQASSSLTSPQECPVSQNETMPRVDPVPQARGFAQSPSLTDSVLLKDKFRATCPQTSTIIPQDNILPQSFPDSRSGVDLDLLSSRTSKETSSVSIPQSSSLNTTTVTQQTVYRQSFPPNSQCDVPPASSSFNQAGGGLPEVHAPILSEPNRVSTIITSSSAINSTNRFSSKQSHQTVFSPHKSLTSTCTQQCVHDSGMTPSSTAKPAAPPQPEAQTQALARQANLHVTPLSSQPHLLTPDQDSNICQPMAIREEIRLTPQIQGPALPAPPPLPQAQAESLPQGKASKPGPPCFTRPLSRATVMGGSPVTLEVEVTGHPEPALTWFKDGDASAAGPGRAPAREDEKHFLFIPEASDSGGGLYEAGAANHHDPRRAANSSSSDKWLVAEVFDIISEDWQTWFGTLCVVLWLLYLIVL
ncbi:titin homolog isoform X2 [Micropterus salmoides]|uniref:titin homolog isoform X2 n=1 Tax=Micropterus salmoides TaxID=27706 RepID=UPI0018EB4776|nr:titin homolog isoform X2 [Micropterus salmoides]